MAPGTFFNTCLCGHALTNQSPEHADYVLDGRPLCMSCYMQRIVGLDSDWDCPPERVRPVIVGESPQPLLCVT